MKDIIKKIFLCILIIFIFLTTNIVYYKNTYSINKNFKSLKLKNINKLIIVAHPKDEILWSGAHLIEDNYLVVCVTCGDNYNSKKDFVKVIKKTKDQYIMLGYSEYNNDAKDNWNNYKKNITTDLESILNLKDWQMIITHNKDGEYGDIQHKIINKIVTDKVKDIDKLYYFGTYYNKKNISSYYDYLIPINKDTLKIKKQLIGYYKKDTYIQTMFNHMFEYENWLPANEWSELDEKAE